MGTYRNETAFVRTTATGKAFVTHTLFDTNSQTSPLSINVVALIPKVAFENPELSFSLSAYQTSCGAFDIFNHVLDNYYFAGEATFDMILEFQEAVMRAVVKWAPIAMKEPDNYEARANLMWASSISKATLGISALPPRPIFSLVFILEITAQASISEPVAAFVRTTATGKAFVTHPPMKEPDNYEARANLMWASSMALNTVLDAGTVHDCACHAMEHELS